MAEKIVSPGVFTRENDLSFLQQGVANIGAAFIGPFKQGPLTPTIVNSQTEFETLFGTVDDTYYTPLAVQNYLREAGTATICRVAGLDGYTENRPVLLTAARGNVTSSIAVLFNTTTAATGLSGSTITTDTSGRFTITLSGSSAISASLVVDDSDDVEAVFGTSVFGAKTGYVYGFFKNHDDVQYDESASVRLNLLGSQDFTNEAQEAQSPYIQSQLISGDRYNLFQFETLTAGNAANTKIKVGITNIKPAGSVSGTDYGTFTIVVRDFADTNKKKVVLETYSNVNLDPNSANFISRVIGDRKLTIDEFGKITETGDWVNNSKYIRIKNLNENAPLQAVPFGHEAYHSFISASASLLQTLPAVTNLTASATQYGGIDLDFNTDNVIYLKPIPEGATNAYNANFGLDVSGGGNLELTGSLSTDVIKRNFLVAFQHGFDGVDPKTPIYKGSDINAGNSQGFDLTLSTSQGTRAYNKHIAALSNADEWDINMIVTPGVVQKLHPSVVNSVIDLCEQRSDCFYIMDGVGAGASVADAISQDGGAGAVDTNYAASYYPWVKTIDVNTNKLISVPPSVLLPGVFASNDRVAAEWFAPAGLNRGGLTGAVSVLNRLTQTEKDDLYEGKVNPIVQFPGQGIVVFGQKTLQDKASALDRINVRRLLLTVRKYIASTSRYLVFEQNTSTTRNAFLNIVNPYLSSIQQNQGLYAFRVVMDDTNNTPDVIDRNIMKGSIFLQPTKTAEFIQIDFNILPTGAAFNG
jgi:hypothetical protein